MNTFEIMRVGRYEISVGHLLFSLETRTMKKGKSKMVLDCERTGGLLIGRLNSHIISGISVEFFIQGANSKSNLGRHKSY